MNFFDEAALRLKQQLKVTEDKQVAETLEMTGNAWTKRKLRGAFPEKELYTLAAKRPELGLDVDYVLTGISSGARGLPDAARAHLEWAGDAGIALGARIQELARDIVAEADRAEAGSIGAIFPTTWGYLGFLRGEPAATRSAVERAAEHLACYRCLPTSLRADIARAARLLAMTDAVQRLQAADTGWRQPGGHAPGHAGPAPTAPHPAAIPAPARAPQVSGVRPSGHFAAGDPA